MLSAVAGGGKCNVWSGRGHERACQAAPGGCACVHMWFLGSGRAAAPPSKTGAGSSQRLVRAAKGGSHTGQCRGAGFLAAEQCQTYLPPPGSISRVQWHGAESLAASRRLPREARGRQHREVSRKTPPSWWRKKPDCNACSCMIHTHASSAVLTAPCQRSIRLSVLGPEPEPTRTTAGMGVEIAALM